MNDPRAGQLATAADLVDVSRLVTAYFTLHPDVENPAQQVAFGTSGHRGSALTASFNEDHILATSQAICEYRAGQGIDGPLFLGADTHALSEPATVSALEVFAGQRGRGAGRRPRRVHADPVGVPRHPGGERRRSGPARTVSCVTPSHNPPADGGFKYNPPDGGPAGTDITGWIQDRANALLRAGLQGVRRVSLSQRAGEDVRLPGRVRRLARRCRRPARPSGALECGSARTRWAVQASPTGAPSASGTAST